jgi:hypothetical protein
VIALQSREGWLLSAICRLARAGTTLALRATPPDSGGEFQPLFSSEFTDRLEQTPHKSVAFARKMRTNLY